MWHYWHHVLLCYTRFTSDHWPLHQEMDGPKGAEARTRGNCFSCRSVRVFAFTVGSQWFGPRFAFYGKLQVSKNGRYILSKVPQILVSWRLSFTRRLLFSSKNVAVLLSCEWSGHFKGNAKTNIMNFQNYSDADYYEYHAHKGFLSLKLRTVQLTWDGLDFW